MCAHHEGRLRFLGFGRGFRDMHRTSYSCVVPDQFDILVQVQICRRLRMRLWHKDLIPYLPQQHLIAQWRELCLIAGLLAKDHTPNHILVNPILDYDPSHFISYCSLVYKECYERGYQMHDKPRKKLEDDIRAWQLYLRDSLPWKLDDKIPVPYADLYAKWHNQRYPLQAYYNDECYSPLASSTFSFLSPNSHKHSSRHQS